MPSERVRRAVAPFGIVPGDSRGAAPRADAGTVDALAALGPGGVGLVTGASGTGKSTLVRALVDRLRARGDRVEEARAGALARSGRAVVEVVRGPLDEAMGALSAAGLAEASLLGRPARELSEGERWRLVLARAISRAARTGTEGRAWVVADEFCSALDRATGEAVAFGLGRWVRRRQGVRLVCAAAHEDMPRLLRPDLLAEPGSGGAWEVREPRPGPRRPNVSIAPGTIADYDALGRLHYRGGRPATWTRVLCAWRGAGRGRLLAGVLVVSRPTLNAAWRDLAWPGRYSTGSLSARARRINRELRCISRVVVEPRSRGMGIARRLVGAYLAEAQTPATEALAAMGEHCPFFERAGMRAYRPAVRPPDARLLDALAHAGLDAGALMFGESAEDAAASALVRRELRRWADASRATRGLLALGWAELARAAGRRLAARPIAYAHVGGGRGDG